MKSSFDKPDKLINPDNNEKETLTSEEHRKRLEAMRRKGIIKEEKHGLRQNEQITRITREKAQEINKNFAQFVYGLKRDDNGRNDRIRDIYANRKKMKYMFI